MHAVFISYRRDDAEGQAGRLYNDLEQRFGAAAVFMDVATIQPGRDFRRVLEERMAGCTVLLAVLGKRWLDARDADGQRRLDKPGDFVRLEIASALARDLPVIPVLVQQAGMPGAAELPADLAALAYRQSFELTHAKWDSDVELLADMLRPLLAGPAPAPGTTAPPAPAPGPEQAPPHHHPHAHGRWRWLASGAAVAALLAAAAWWAVQRSDTRVADAEAAARIARAQLQQAEAELAMARVKAEQAQLQARAASAAAAAATASVQQAQSPAERAAAVREANDKTQAWQQARSKATQAQVEALEKSRMVANVLKATKNLDAPLATMPAPAR